jgi:hypothetical protein
LLGEAILMLIFLVKLLQCWIGCMMSKQRRCERRREA